MTTAREMSPPNTSSASPASGAPLSRRVEAKMNTRFRIRSAAVDLFRDHGFNHVTTEQIAFHAGVTQRTLFRHFRTKDAILFDDDSIVEFFDEVLGAQLARHQPMEAVRLALRDISAGYDRNAETFRANHALIVGSEMLQAFARQRTSRLDDLLALALDGVEAFTSRKAPATASSRIAASAMMGLLRPLTDAWLSGEIDLRMVEVSDTIWPILESLVRRCNAVIPELTPRSTTVI